jgi:uncharacterized protein YndB with AHSA1/START domain
VTSSAQRTRRIAAPIDRVWDVLAGFDDIAVWAPSLVDHSSAMGGPERGVGAARRIQVGRNTIIETVETWDPPRVLMYRLDGLPKQLRRVTNEWRLEADDGWTDAMLVTTVEVGPRPPQQLIERVALRRLEKASDGLLDGLSDHVLRVVGGQS